MTMNTRQFICILNHNLWLSDTIWETQEKAVRIICNVCEWTEKNCFHKMFIVYLCFGCVHSAILTDLKNQQLAEKTVKKAITMKTQKSIQILDRRAERTNTVPNWMLIHSLILSIAGVENHQNFSDHVMWTEQPFLQWKRMSDWCIYASEAHTLHYYVFVYGWRCRCRCRGRCWCEQTPHSQRFQLRLVCDW